MEKKVLAGSPEDRRWLAPIDPDQPQTIKSKPKKSNVLKKVRDENSALKIKLDKIVEKNLNIVVENRNLKDKFNKVEKELKALKKQLSKEAEDVVKATIKKPKSVKKTTKKIVKKKSNMPRKSTRKV